MTADRDDLEAALHGPEAERLRSARELRRHPDRQLLKALIEARARERVRWVRTALDEAIESCKNAGSGVRVPLVSKSAAEDDSDARQAYLDGRSDGLRQALHEISPLVGLARAAAEEGEEEAIAHQLERLRAVCAGLRSFVSAAQGPDFREFDLSKIARHFAKQPPLECPADLIGARGTVPLIARGDPDLLQLALRPVVINAIEAVVSLGPPLPAHGIVISWGVEGHSSWVAVIDRGPGLESSGDLFAAGATTKHGHLGFGLTTTQTAMASLGGRAEISSNRDGGATVVLEWPGRPDAG